MLNQRATELGSAPNKIRELFAYGLKRKAEIGEENVFDFSIGNPSVPAPDAVAESIAELIKEPPCALHGYTPSPGAAGPRQAVADNISRRFGIDATADQVYLTAGAAAGLAISIYAITNPGDEIMVISPYFPEYAVWAETAGCTTIEVPAHEPDFQMDIDAIDAAFTPKTAGIIINSPNNPVGAVYTRENLEALAALLSRKEEEYGHPIYLISDEPYREITYGAEVPYVPTLYKRTIVCYSYSKSLSLPGERIGYIYVSNLMDNAKEVYTAVSGAGRALGFICTAVLFQRVMEKCVNEPSDVEARTASCSRRVFPNWGTNTSSPMGHSICGFVRLNPTTRRFARRRRPMSFCSCPQRVSSPMAGCASATACPPMSSSAPCPLSKRLWRNISNTVGSRLRGGSRLIGREPPFLLPGRSPRRSFGAAFRLRAFRADCLRFWAPPRDTILDWASRRIQDCVPRSLKP